MAVGIVPYGVGIIRSHFTSTAITAAIPVVMAGVAWIVKNQGHIIQGATTVMAVKDCVLDNKIRAQRDNCFNSFRFLQENIGDLSGFNASDYNNHSKTALSSIVNGISQRNFALQWLTDLNQRTLMIWDKFDLETQKEMKKNGLIPGTLSLDNIAKSAADMALWVQIAGDATDRHVQCKVEKDICTLGKNTAIDSGIKDKDELIKAQKTFKEQNDILLVRKGKCEDLENTLKENNRLREKEKKCINMEGNRNFWKTKYLDLKKQYDESQMGFFKRLTGL